LTINSLFYNINTGTVEDWTGFGLNDLKNRIARTPLDPTTTFTDDPLRVLRTLRFSARLSLTILPEVKQALLSLNVYNSLLNKISRERVFKEYHLMIIGKNHMLALEYLMEYKLFPTIFKIPEGFPDFLDSGYDVIKKIIRPRSEDNFYLYTAGILANYELLGDFNLVKNKKDVKIYEFICTDSLKISNSDTLIISSILKNLKNCIQILKNFDVVQVYEIIRDTKEKYEICITLAAYFSIHNINEAEEAIARMKELILSHEIDKIWEEKPLVNVFAI
jgi:tRNA nucleotidyltransferase/poly(A) polymerase